MLHFKGFVSVSVTGNFGEPLLPSTTNRNPANDQAYCISNEDCPSGQLCIGDCTSYGDDNILVRRTCCVINTHPENNDCCNGSLSMSIQNARCRDYDIGGTFVQFAPSLTSPSWTYIQLGNYNAMLMLETLRHDKRFCHSSLFGHCLQSTLFDKHEFSFKPPAWTILHSPTDISVDKGSLFHVAFSNDLNSTCPGDFEGVRQAWTCYDYIMERIGWRIETEFLEVNAGRGTIQC